MIARREDRRDGGRCGRIARLRALPHDTRGASALEFAILAAPLIALLLAILETSLLFFAQQEINTTAEATARLITTGSAQKGGLSASQLKAAACATLPVFLQCANLMIDVQTASSFSAANTKSLAITYDANGNVTNNFSYATGGAGDIVVLKLMYLWPVATGPLGFNLGNQPNSKRLITSVSVTKTEPYS